MDEEDIMFENSPLHRYLMENGVASEVVARDSAARLNSRAPSSFFAWTKLLEFLSTSFMKLFQYFDIETVDCFHENNFFKCVLSSRLLEEDDEEALKNISLLFDKHSSESNKLEFFRLFLWQIPAAIMLISIIIGLRMTAQQSNVSLSFVQLLFVFVLLFWTLQIIWNITKHFLWNKEYKNLKLFIELENRLDSEFKKILTVLRDREIVSRGYTIVTQRTPAFDDHVTNLLNGNQLPLLKLRNNMLKCVSDLLYDFRSQTKELLSNKRLTSINIFASDQFILANVDDDYFHSLFNSYDSLTLSALKALCRYFSLQRSEFLRLLVLCRCNRFLILRNNTLERNRVLEFPLFDNYLLRLSDKTKHSLNVLQTAVKLCSPRTLLETCIEKNCASVSQRPESTRAAALNSLQLHLQVALEKSLNLLDNENVDEKFISLLLEIEFDLKACLNCSEEIRTSLTEDKHTVESVPIISKLVQHVEPTKTRFVDDDFEPLIEDQVFEAIVRRTDEDNNTCKLDDDKIVTEKSTLPRRNLLNELKSVLSVRSTLMQEREMRALAASRGLSIDDLIKENERAEDDHEEKTENDDRSLFHWIEHPNSHDAIENIATPSVGASIFGTCLADELKKALVARGTKNYELQIGDDSNDDEDSVE